MRSGLRVASLVSLPARRSLGVVVCLCGLLVVPQAQSAAPLGKISFPNSGAPAAQADFIRGVLWLHSFGYEEAIDAFRAAQKIDPDSFWPTGARPWLQPAGVVSPRSRTRGAAALMKLGPTPQARASKAKTPRERELPRARSRRCSGRATRPPATEATPTPWQSWLAHPQDDEVQAFYALSLLAILPRGDQALPQRQKAGAIVEGVFKRNPQHPGAPHYILHAYDHPALAARALPAARAYAKIAPGREPRPAYAGACFVQRGLWDEAAATDEASWNASIAWAARRKLSIAMRDFHSLSWLQYEWTQQGRFAQARGGDCVVDQAMKVVGTRRDASAAITTRKARSAAAAARPRSATIADRCGRALIDRERALGEMKGQGSFDNIDELFALGMSAFKLGDTGRLTAAVGEFEKLSHAAARRRDEGTGAGDAARARGAADARRTDGSKRPSTPWSGRRWRRARCQNRSGVRIR